MNSTFSRHATLTIATMVFMGTLVTYVETMITPAVPILIRAFSTNYDALSWVITAYILSGTVSAAIFGRLADMYGKKRIFVAMAVAYSVAVTLGGFAQSLEEFVAIRAVQGLGMGMFPVAFALLNDQVPKRNLALAQGVLSSTFITGAIVGLVGGAWITQNFGWEWSYHSAIPFAYALVIFSATMLRDSPQRIKEKIDFTGIGLLSVGLVALILGIAQGQYWGWLSAGILASFAISGTTLVAFVYAETKVPSPFISLKLLRIRNVFLANFVGLFALSAMFFLFFTIPALLQDPSPVGFGETILTSGLTLMPAALAAMAFAPLSALVTRNRGPKIALVIGSLLVLLSYVGLFFNRGSVVAIVEDATLTGIGMSFNFVGIINLLLLSTPKEEAGVSTGMNVVFRNIGSAIAPAIGGVLETTYVQKVGPYSFPSSTAFDYIYMIGMVFLIVSVIFTLMMRNIVPKAEDKVASPSA